MATKKSGHFQDLCFVYTMNSDTETERIGTMCINRDGGVRIVFVEGFPRPLNQIFKLFNIKLRCLHISQ